MDRADGRASAKRMDRACSSRFVARFRKAFRARVGGVGARLQRTKNFLLGDDPKSLRVLLAPTALALAIDLVLRIRGIASFWIGGKAIYFSSWAVSAAFWALPLFFVARGLQSAIAVARTASIAVLVLFVFPLATFAYGGQVLYYRVFGVYVGRDTVRLGIALRGTVGDWFSAWGGPFVFVAIAALGAALTFGFVVLLRKRPPSTTRVPWLLLPLFCASIFCFWTDNVDSRFLQAALPDACFVHGCIHALRAKVTGKWNERQGVSIRTPAPLPPLVSTRAKKPNVLVVLTESVRADSLCSDPSRCKDDMLDPVAPDRMSLGILRAETPNTFSACMILWSGLGPTATFREAHTAPLLWEVAHAVGYSTLYVTSQNPNFEDFGAYVRRAGIDTIEMGPDLGGMAQEQLGAPDERATAEMLRVVRATKTPYFGVLQLSNTHAPYRTDPGLLPFQPESDSPFSDTTAYENHYRNAVRLQMRTLAAFLKELRALPSWNDTVLIFLSDHGEELRDHGGLYHNHSLYEEQLRIPGFVVAGPNALSDAERSALASYASRHTYAADVHATVLDLLGVFDARATLPLADRTQGRSLVRAADASEPVMLLSTSTSVWQPDDARFGATQGTHVVVGWGPTEFLCFDTTNDPTERAPLPVSRCRTLKGVVNEAFHSQMSALGWR